MPNFILSIVVNLMGSMPRHGMLCVGNDPSAFSVMEINVLGRGGSGTVSSVAIVVFILLISTSENKRRGSSEIFWRLWNVMEENCLPFWRGKSGELLTLLILEWKVRQARNLAVAALRIRSISTDEFTKAGQSNILKA
jgi:hypothetical protein